jgi:2-dehydro-3-deoxygluconokinase
MKQDGRCDLLGTRARWCSRVGDDPFGRRLLAELNAAGVDTSLVTVTAARPGVFFKGRRDIGVHYYRDGSANETQVRSGCQPPLLPVARAAAGLHLLAQHRPVRWSGV